MDGNRATAAGAGRDSGRDAVKALIKVGYACNQHCAFCHRLDLRHLDAPSAEVHRRIDRAKELGHDMVVLSGGEPTIRPELLEWAAHAASLGMDLGLVTNGQMLSYPELVARLRRHRLAYVYLSLHGGSAEVHDRVVRAHSFDRARAGLENLAGLDVELVVNTVVTRENLDHLRPVVDLLLEYHRAVYKLSMVEPRGGGARHFEAVVPRVSDVAVRVREAIEHGARARGAAPGPRFAHDGIPLCLLPGCEELYDDLKTSGFATMAEVGEPDFFAVDDRGKVKPPKCGECALRGPCPGLFRLYYERRGDEEIAPVTDRPRSNSFNYAFERALWGREHGSDRCPLIERGVFPWARERTLFVRDEGGIALYRARTRDFADDEIEAIKHGTGQLYLDLSDKPAVDSFPEDLAKLRRSALCDACPERDGCSGMFERAPEDVFGRDEARVRALLARSAGEVLEVGCGEGRYGDILGPLAQAGRIRYLGIDPDPRRVERLGERWPWATVRVDSAESLSALGARRFDRVLVLRSWNHLRDLEEAMTAIARLLRPGGHLVVADDVAFGLARSREQASRGESSVAGFEHYRNHGAEEAHRVITRFGLGLIERRDVTPATSNQWLLVYRAPEDCV